MIINCITHEHYKMNIYHQTISYSKGFSLILTIREKGRKPHSLGSSKSFSKNQQQRLSCCSYGGGGAEMDFRNMVVATRRDF